MDIITQLKNLQNLFEQFVDGSKCNVMHEPNNRDIRGNDVNLARNVCDTYLETNKSIGLMNEEIVSRKRDIKALYDSCNYTNGFNRPGDVNGTGGGCQSINTTSTVMYEPNNRDIGGSDVNLARNVCDIYLETNKSIGLMNEEIVSRKRDPKALYDSCNYTNGFNRPGDVTGTGGGCQLINTTSNVMYEPNNRDIRGNDVNLARNVCDTYLETNKSIGLMNEEIVSRKRDPKALYDLCSYTNGNNRLINMNGTVGECESYSETNKPNNNLWHVELLSPSEKSMVIDIFQQTITTNAVMGINLRNETTFKENCLDQILTKAYMSEKESHTNLTNYFYYLPENSVSHDLLDLRTGNEVCISEMAEEMVPQNQSESGGESSKYVTLNDNMMGYNLGSFTGNQISSSKMRKEMVEQNHSEIEGESNKYVTLTDDGTLGCNLGSCVGNDIDSSEMRKGMAEQNQSGTGCESSEYVTFSVDTSGEGFEVDTEQTTSNADVKPCNLNFMNVKPRQGCDNTKMRVPTTDEGRYTKKLCCYYCLKPYPKLARHLAAVHKNEKEVKKFLVQPVGSRKRRAIIDKIRKWGQFEWNSDAKLNKGVLSTSRRPSKKYRRRATHYKTCAKCRGTYSSNVLRYHWKKCTKNCLPGERIINELSRAVEGRLHESAFDDLRIIIFPKMHEDEEVLAIRYDWIVITFGNDLCLNYSPHYQHAMIRTKLRNAGKLLLASRKNCPNIKDFDSIYYVKNCNAVIEAIRMIAKFDAKSKTFESPGTAATLVTLVNTIGELLIIECMKEDDEDKERSVERFLKVFKKEAKIKILKIVIVCQLKAQREKIENIPSTDDIGRLATWLDHELEKCFMELTERYSLENWLYLAQLTMMSILVFNRKRVGDMQNVLVGDFRRREIITERCDAEPKNTREMIKSRVKVRGKLYRTVPILLKHNYDDCLDLLLRYRKDAAVPDNNEFLFGVPSKSGKIKTIDAGALFRKFSELCGAENPSSLRGTNLRKQFASMMATIDLSDNALTNVANFMGHSDKVHKDVYRQNPLQQEVIQMSALLEFSQGKNNVDTVGQVTQGKKIINTDGQVATSSENPKTKRKQTKKQANVVPTKKPRNQINEGQVAPSNKNPETRKKRTKKQADVVPKKKSRKRIKGH